MRSECTARHGKLLVKMCFCQSVLYILTKKVCLKQFFCTLIFPQSAHNEGKLHFKKRKTLAKITA